MTNGDRTDAGRGPASGRERTDWTGRLLRVRVEGPAQGGEFVARHEGRVVFCRGTLTGEVVEVMVDDDPGRGFCRATVREVLDPAPERTRQWCEAAAAGAGCCDWSHIDPGAAWGFHGRVLAEQAGRIGRFDPPRQPVPVGPPGQDDATTGWRTIARWVTGPDGRPGVRRSRSRDLVTRECAQPDPRLFEAVLAADVGPRREVLAVLGDDDVVHVAHRAATGDDPRRGGRGGSRSAATRARARHARGGPWVAVGGDGMVCRRVGSRTWYLPVDSFWQAHRSAAAHYSDVVRAAVGDAPALPAEPVVWDLYGGAGLFAAAARDAVAGSRVTVVESAPGSVAGAERVLGPEGGFRTVRSRVEAFLETEAPDAASGPGAAGWSGPDVVVLDPPRGGAGIPVMERLAAVTRSRIVHVGCDPASLARDVGVLVAAGWTVRELRGVAAFPGTHHVEGIAVVDAPRRA